MSDKKSMQSESFSKTVCRFAGFLSSFCQVILLVSFYTFVRFGIFDHGNRPVGPTILIGFFGIGALISAIVCFIAGIISLVGAMIEKRKNAKHNDA